MDINIERIMDDIRAEIKEKGYTADMLSFSDVTGVTRFNEYGEFNVNEYNDVVAQLKCTAMVPLSAPVKGNPIVAFLKKLIRRFTRVAIRPVAEHQTEYNANSARALAMLGDYIRQNTADATAPLLEKIETLELKLQTAAKEIDRLNDRLAALENDDGSVE